MNEIIEKDVSELQSKGKKFKMIVKRSLLGVISTALVFSTIPNIEYQVALDKANNSTYIEEVLSSNQSKEEQISQIFEEAIKNNNNISDDIKDKVIDSFTTQVINRAGVFFSDETIKNMYAVASTERIIQMSNFSKEHGWWSGSYNSYYNIYSLFSDTKEEDESLIAHEQLHAILKNGLIDTGLTKGLINGYGANEAFTTFLGNEDDSYFDENNIINILGIIVGYNNILQHYLDSDLSGFKKELNQYISPKETNKFIHNLDLDVFSGYLQTFLEKNNIPYNTDRLLEKSKNRKIENIDILKKIFENRYGISAKDSKLGQLIFNSVYFIPDDEFDLDQTFYNITLNDKNDLKISAFNYSLDGIASGIINKSCEQLITKKEYGKDFIAKEFDLDEIGNHSIEYINDHQSKITINLITFIVNADDLATFDYDQALKDAIDKIQSTNSKISEDERE